MNNKSSSDSFKERGRKLDLLLKENKISQDEYDKKIKKSQMLKKLEEKMNNIDEKIFELFQGESDEPLELDESDLINMSVYERNDHYGDLFPNDTYRNNHEENDDFRNLTDLDEFVQYKCVQKLKKITIALFHFYKGNDDNLLITNIAPLAKIKNLEELFFTDEDLYNSYGVGVNYYSSVKFPNIKHLKVIGIHDCCFLLNFPNVESLTLGFPDLFRNYKLTRKVDLSFMKNLKTLELLDCPYKATEFDKVELDDLVDGISTLENLETLVVHTINPDNDEEGVFFSFQHFTSQNLSKLNKLKTVVILGGFPLDVSFALEIPNLKTLVLDDENVIVDKTILESVSFKTEFCDSDSYFINDMPYS